MDATGTEPEEWALWRAFLVSHALIARRVDAQLQRDAGLAQGEYAAITAILESPDRQLRVGEIADALGWERTRVSHLVGRMKQRGLLDRKVCADDARSVEITVTPEGRRKQLAAMRGHATEVHRVFLEQVQPDERTIIARALSRVIKNLDRTI